jgi:hypothetical protein
MQQATPGGRAAVSDESPGGGRGLAAFALQLRHPTLNLESEDCMRTVPRLVPMIVIAMALPVTAFAQAPKTEKEKAAEDKAREEQHERDTAAVEAAAPPDTDQPPPPPEPTAPTGIGLVSKAGVGSPIGYARQGVLELGGSAGFSASDDLTRFVITPSIGWFVWNNIQISALFGLEYVKASGESATYTTILAEPSYHYPFSRTLFAFVGIGAGLSYASSPGAGVAISPRVGANILVGRSGVLTPAIAWDWTSHDTQVTDEGMTLVPASEALTAEIGYTGMW